MWIYKLQNLATKLLGCLPIEEFEVLRKINGKSRPAIDVFSSPKCVYPFSLSRAFLHEISVRNLNVEVRKDVECLL